VLLQGKREKGQGKSTEGSSLFGRFLLPFSVCLLPFVLLCTLNSAGYRYGASDLAFYIPAALEKLDPALFPRDGALIASQARLTMIDETIWLLSRVTGLGLPLLFATLYATTLALLLAATLLVGRMLYRGRWATLALAAAVTLRHAIAKSGTNTLEGYFHPRQLAFSLGLLAVVALMRRRILVSVALVFAGGLLHPTTALWFAIWIAVAWSVNEPQWRGRVAIVAAIAALAGAWMLVGGPLEGRLVRMDSEWLATLETKDYLFPLEWPAYVWLINLVYAPTIILIYRRRRDADQRVYQLRILRRKLECHRAAALRAHEMHTLAVQRVYQCGEILEQHVDGPFIISGHRSRTTEAAHVDTHDTILAREMRHPAAPRFAAFSKTVYKKYGRRRAPWVRVIVDAVEQAAAIGSLQKFIHVCLASSACLDVESFLLRSITRALFLWTWRQPPIS